MTVNDKTIEQSLAFIEGKIPLDEVTNFSRIVCNNLIKKYGAQNLRNDILSSDGDTEINNTLTNILEVGALYLLYNRGLIKRNQQELFLATLAVSFTINRLIAKELVNRGVLPTTSSVIYSISAQQELVKRTIKLCKECYLNYNLFTKLIGNRDVWTMFKIYLDPYYIDPIRYRPL